MPRAPQEYTIDGILDQAMAFTVSDLREMIELLEQHPDWKQVLRTVLLGEELLALPQLVRELVDIQRQQAQALARIESIQAEMLQVQRQHTEWLQRLTEGQQRHEELLRQHGEWLQRLTEGQQRHEELLRQHGEWLQRLTEGQQRHEQRMDEFAIEQQRMRATFERELENIRSDLARFTTKLGLEIEEQAEDTLQWVMEQKGWKLVEGPRTLTTNGEIDVVAVFENEQGQRVTVLMEVKLRLNRRTVEAWATRVRSEGFTKRLRRHGLTPPYWVYLFGFRIEWTAGKVAEQRQIGLMTARGEVLPPIQLS